MTAAMLIIFWFSAFMIFYAYFGYPLALLILSAFRKATPSNTSSAYKPLVSHIIAAYNEKERIREKIINAIEQTYPKDRMEVIIASDCSTDGTDEIAGSFADKGVRLVRATERKGKENAQKHAVSAARGEILVFSDVSTRMKPDGISNIVRNFADSSIGCVSSEDRFIDADGTISGEGAYVKYEMFLRNLESKVNSLVGMSGSFFAARREVCSDWATDLQSDFNTVLNCVKRGLRGVSDPATIGYYHNIIEPRKEFDRKVRTVVRGITVCRRSLSLLNVLKHGLFAWQFISHKICRWIVPCFMTILLMSNTVLAFEGGFYLYAAILQFGFYLVATLGCLAPRYAENKVVKISAFFVMANFSILYAWFLFIRGERIVQWNPSKR
jgi:glycosyltransferase involved in cell wall biosynthesis